MPTITVKGALPGKAQAEPVECGDAGALVTNKGPNTVYYRDEEPVSLSVNDGSVSSGSSVTLYGTVFFVVDEGASASRSDSATLQMDLQQVSAAGSQTPTAVKTANYTASGGDAVLVDVSGGAVTVTLPAAQAGRTVAVKKVDASNNAITVTPAGTDTIEGYATHSIVSPNVARVYTADGVGVWRLVTGYAPLSGPGSARYDRTRNIFLPSDTCLLNLKKAVALGRYGGRAARVIARGDSTTFGTISGTNPGSLAQQKISWIPRARAILQASGQMGGVVTESLMDMRSGSDSRVTLGTGWATYPAQAASTATGALTFVDDSQSNAFDLVVQRLSGTPTSFTVSIDGAGAQTIDISSLTVSRQTATFRVAVSGGAVSTHTIAVNAPNAGTIGILNIEPVNTNSLPILKLGQFGVSGQTLATLAPTSTGTGSNMESFLKMAPDAIFLLMGINDMHFWAVGNGTPAQGAATYRTNLDAFVTAFRAINCDPIFMVFPSYNYASQNPGVYENLLWQQQIFDSAEANDVAVLDLQRRWGYGTAPTTNYGTTPAAAAAMYDGTHPTLVGYNDIGRMLANFLATVV